MNNAENKKKTRNEVQPPTVQHLPAKEKQQQQQQQQDKQMTPTRSSERNLSIAHPRPSSVIETKECVTREFCRSFLPVFFNRVLEQLGVIESELRKGLLILYFCSPGLPGLPSFRRFFFW